MASADAEDVRETPIVKAIQKSAPAVVNIGTEQLVLLGPHPVWGTYGGQLDQFYSNFFSTHSPFAIGNIKIQSLGSGVLVSRDGLIATNAHVVGMASKIFVTLQSGESKEAVLIGTDNENDIALLQIKTDKETPFVELSQDAIVGETVVSIGSPMGLQNSVSAGIVSAVNRTLQTQPQVGSLKDLIQTDAPINQGSSGGALINLEGKLTGLNLAVMDHTQGLGFAVPAWKVKKMLEEYEKVRSNQKKT